MATIGLRDPYYALITENALGEEVYGTPVRIGKAISANLSVELAEAILYADDAASESVKEFKQGTLSLGLDDLSKNVQADILGATVDSNGVLISGGSDSVPYVAVGFRARKAKGNYRYFWLYKVKFGIPGTEMQTKGDSITFATPTLEGTITTRNKLDGNGKNPWKAEITVGEGGISASDAVIVNWFNAVYEGSITPPADASLASLTVSGATLSSEFVSTVKDYTGTATGSSASFTYSTKDTNATATLFLNNTYKSSGASLTLVSGLNVIKIVVNNGKKSEVYTFEITKS